MGLCLLALALAHPHLLLNYYFLLTTYCLLKLREESVFDTPSCEFSILFDDLCLLPRGPVVIQSSYGHPN